ncbi:zinc-ribbon domain-containing protein [Lachnospiraceae bacterium]|nr:zinc-ribbon domain-containing protein [Lachnospiraceae bacterium]
MELENRKFAYCVKCGAKVDSSTKFCPDCGTPIEVPGNSIQYKNDTKSSAVVIAVIALLVLAMVVIIGFVFIKSYGFIADKANTIVQEKIENIEKEPDDRGVRDTEQVVERATEEASTEEPQTTEGSGELPTETEVRACLDRFRDWSGTHMLATQVDIFGLDVQSAVPMAMAYVSYDHSKYEYDETGCSLVIPNEDIEDGMEELFGRKFDLDDYEVNSKEYMVDRSGQDAFLMKMGDWGDTYPMYDINSIEEGDTEGTFTINAEYYPWSDPDNARWDRYTMVASYECEIAEDSPNGFYITNVIYMCSDLEGTSGSTTESKGPYLDSELIDMATRYYVEKHELKPPYVEIDHRDGNEVMIQLYEIIDNGDESHIATWDWFTIDRTTGKGEDVLGNPIDLTEVE